MSHPANPEGCSNVIVQVLKLTCVPRVVDVLGAKIDSLFVALKHSSIKLVLCRQAQMPHSWRLLLGD